MKYESFKCKHVFTIQIYTRSRIIKLHYIFEHLNCFHICEIAMQFCSTVLQSYRYLLNVQVLCSQHSISRHVEIVLPIYMQTVSCLSHVTKSPNTETLFGRKQTVESNECIKRQSIVRRKTSLDFKLQLIAYGQILYLYKGVSKTRKIYSKYA